MSGAKNRIFASFAVLIHRKLLHLRDWEWVYHRMTIAVASEIGCLWHCERTQSHKNESLWVKIRRFCIPFDGIFCTECWGLGASSKNWFQKGRSNGRSKRNLSEIPSIISGKVTAWYSLRQLLFGSFLFFVRVCSATWQLKRSNCGSAWRERCFVCARRGRRVLESSYVGTLPWTKLPGSWWPCTLTSSPASLRRPRETA